jgi:hypothetical protein
LSPRGLCGYHYVDGRYSFRDSIYTVTNITSDGGFYVELGKSSFVNGEYEFNTSQMRRLVRHAQDAGIIKSPSNITCFRPTTIKKYKIKENPKWIELFDYVKNRVTTLCQNSVQRDISVPFVLTKLRPHIKPDVNSVCYTTIHDLTTRNLFDNNTTNCDLDGLLYIFGISNTVSNSMKLSSLVANFNQQYPLLRTAVDSGVSVKHLLDYINLCDSKKN